MVHLNAQIIFDKLALAEAMYDSHITHFEELKFQIENSPKIYVGV